MRPNTWLNTVERQAASRNALGEGAGGQGTESEEGAEDVTADKEHYLHAGFKQRRGREWGA